jgi:DNA integrity scanning protein DisA with diadenylate cyclase activity
MQIEQCVKINDIFNRIFKILVNKLMTHLINLFQVYVVLNYHLRCFHNIYIIILKKSKKKITQTLKRINRLFF